MDGITFFYEQKSFGNWGFTKIVFQTNSLLDTYSDGLFEELITEPLQSIKFHFHIYLPSFLYWFVDVIESLKLFELMAWD